jgi:hypothetical protein
MRQLICRIIVLLGVLQACRTPFDPEVPPEKTGFLVVEGYLDSNGLQSKLKLSRTSPLDSESSVLPESGATVFLSSAAGAGFYFLEGDQGEYWFEADLSEDEFYTLEIVLGSGERFRSDPMRPIQTPEIIDAGFVREEDGVEVYVTTKGDSQANDFLWTFEEAWIYRPRIRTNFIYDEAIGDVRTRTANEQSALCFKTAESPNILLETSSRYEEQVVFRQTIAEIPRGDERIMERYSVLISQKAIEDSAVDFWEILKKNTQDIGSIFSPLPSLIRGNIHAVDDPNIPVIGQVSLGVVQQRRVYINLVDVSPWNYLDPEFNDCLIEADAVMIKDYKVTFGSGFTVPARPLMQGTTITGYFPTSKRCSDCRLYASPVAPDFWEDD